MRLVPGSERVICQPESNPVDGAVRWAPGKSIWIGSMTLAAMVGGPLFFNWDALALFVVSTVITICCGHSVGMHRRLIHSSFETPRWVEYTLVYLGTLVGMAGPLGMIRQHDFRDWAQRQQHCHDYFCHRRGFWQDAWWQMHCDLQLANPPMLRLNDADNSSFYAVLERTWMWQQLPWAVLFFLVGGWSWLIWGVCARVSVSVTGHWLVGHYAHREGGQHWVVKGATAQGYNIAVAGLVSMGESWHNNHHAFPGSAKLGLMPGEVDPGWWLICTLKRLGLAWHVRMPEHLPFRPELVRLPDPAARPRAPLLSQS